MPDLDAHLQVFSADTSGSHPPPAGEVRRRGERLLRRRRAASVVAAVVAVLVVVVPLSIAGHGDHQERRPAPAVSSPAPRWRTTIPADFPLDAGRPDVAGDGAVYAAGPGAGRFAYGEAGYALATCRGAAWSSGDSHPRHELAGGYRPARYADRILLTYADPTAARTAYRSLVPAGCAASAGLGDRSASWVLSERQAGDGVEPGPRSAVLVGNALLLAVGESHPRTTLAPAVAQLCVYAAHPCAAPPAVRRPAAHPGWPAVVPASVDLSAGGDLRRDPSSTAGAVVGYCQVPELQNAGIVADQRIALRSAIRNRTEGRSLFLYGDGATATHELAGLRRVLSECVGPAQADGVRLRLAVTSLGDQSLLLTVYDPGTGAGATVSWYRWVRVGSAVVWTASSAGVSTLGPHDPVATADISRQGRDLAPLIARVRRLEPRQAPAHEPRPTGDPATSHVVATPPGLVPAADQLPAPARGAWTVHEGQDTGALECIAGGHYPDVYAGSTYEVAAPDGVPGHDSYRAADQVVTYDTVAHAVAAEHYLNVESCPPARPGISAGGTPGEIGSGSLDSAIYLYDYPDSACPSCGTRRYLGEMVAQVGRHVVLASFSELGGSAAPPDYTDLRLAVLSLFVRTAVD